MPWALLVLVSLLAVVGVTTWFIAPQPVADLIDLFRRLEPTKGGLTVAEMRPLYVDDSAVTALWREFHTAAIAAGLGLALLLWQAVRRARPETVLLLTWSLAILAASLAQRRFTYYLAPVVALLSAGFVCWLLNGVWRRQRQLRGSYRSLALMLALILLLAPNVSQAVSQAQKHSGPNLAWHAALSWLRSNSPEPFADPAAYVADNRSYEATNVAPPRATYGVMSWWDRGYWLIHIARRVPIANPQGYGIGAAAAFYLAQDEGSAQRALADAGARYVIVDDNMPIRQVGGSEIGIGTISSMATWSNKPVNELVERYEVRSRDGGWNPVFFYYPSYFRSMATRLQTFSGQAVHPRSLWVVSFELHRRANGALVKRVTRMKSFSSHPQAIDELARLPGDHHRLVSTDPTASCVPIEALTGLRRVYPLARQESGAPPPVQIFEVANLG